MKQSESAQPENDATNPLLETVDLPPFDRIQTAHVLLAIDKIIDDNRRALTEQLTKQLEPSWNNLVAPFEAREDKLASAWSPVSHLNAVANSPELREIYQQALQKLTEYNTEISQNETLFRAFESLASSPAFQRFDRAQQKTIKNHIRDFHLAGVALPEERKHRYGEIKKRLSELSTQFANNVMDATQGWYKIIEDKTRLAGLPESALDNTSQAARDKKIEGHVITLDAPAYIAIMTHAKDRQLREEVYRAFSARASAHGVAIGGKDPTAWDNQPIIDEVLALRHELAQLLGFANYAERSLATKMAGSTDEVMNFLIELAKTSRPAALREFAQLKTFAKEKFGVEELEPWDLAYYSEKQRQDVFAISEEELRPYFPVTKVIEGLFKVAGRLFDVAIEADEKVATWHQDAHFYRVKRGGKPIAGFYLDIYARDNKRGGAWMGECRVRRKMETGIQLPVAYLTCNFTAPTSKRPSLLTHSEVRTLFHEFGHGLHHMLTQIDCPSVSGINGVAWDGVELPSQFLENWCWHEAVIPLISANYQTGDPLPEELLQKLLRAKNHQSAMQMARQLEFSLFDFRLHLEYDPQNPRDPQALLNEIREQVAVISPPAYNKFQNSFSHIFAGGYAAGYYSYKWAEVLSSDAFSLFEERGIFDESTAKHFLHTVLEQGGSEDAKDLFVKFRGREPSIEALLRHSGISEQGEQLP
ncbi:MAG: M3 family metallopeptidase [Cellvibrionaceae bacterium]